MIEKSEKQLHFVDVGVSDRIPYAKAEIAKACRVSDNFAFSFYQIDYQGMATRFSKETKNAKDINNLLIPVGKVVIDKQTFLQFFNELSKIKKTIDSETTTDEQKD